jgi:predicted RNase H-like nuclease (RuvC/YqgF family)
MYKDAKSLLSSLENQIELLSEQLDKQKKENEKLKKELARIRKTQNLEKIIEQEQEVKAILDFKKEEKAQKYKESALKDRWMCHKCGRGILVVKILHTPSSKIYSRTCDFCPHKTKWKPYSDKVKGIFEKKD